VKCTPVGGATLLFYKFSIFLTNTADLFQPGIDTLLDIISMYLWIAEVKRWLVDT